MIKIKVEMPYAIVRMLKWVITLIFTFAFQLFGIWLGKKIGLEAFEAFALMVMVQISILWTDEILRGRR